MPEPELIPGQLGFAGKSARACALSECGQVFVPARDDAIYCSKACKQKAYRRRRGIPRGRGRHRARPLR